MKVQYVVITKGLQDDLAIITVANQYGDAPVVFFADAETTNQIEAYLTNEYDRRLTLNDDYNSVTLRNDDEHTVVYTLDGRVFVRMRRRLGKPVAGYSYTKQ